MSDRELLDYFGKILMQNVRDDAIDRFDALATRALKSQEALAVSDVLESFSEDERAKIREVSIKMVDATIVRFLRLFEAEDSIFLNVKLKNEVKDIAPISDGLSGELFDIDGWIYKFSKFKVGY